MAIKPKYSLGGKEGNISPKAGKKFTDRVEFLKAFYDALENKVPDEHKMLVYYGVGGIGKTTLRKELCKRLEEEKPDVVYTAIDLDTPTYREQETALFVLRNALNEKNKVHFPTFDIAYTLYWQKTHPQTPLTKDNFPLLTGVNAVAGIMRVVGEMPYIGFVPKLTKAFATGSNVFREWWRKRGEKELANLPSMEPKEISARMPMFWASDLNDFLQEKKKQAVLFLDTYEALWENLKADGGFFLRDEWIRELVSHLPNIIWVVCGREKLRWCEQDEEWDNYIEQHLLGRLSDEDSKYLLTSCGVEKIDVQNVIVKASRGVPHFLDLAVDTYLEIKNRFNREPEAHDFARTQQDVLDRFLRYLDKSEIETLKVLSSARVWGIQIFRMLVNEFKTGYPVTAMDNLCRFSFIHEADRPKHFAMHDLMRESLQSKMDTETLKIVHQSLFDYYNTELAEIDIKNISDIDKHALIEAFYHGKIALDPFLLYDWFNEVTKIFVDAAQFKIILPLSEELLKIIEENNGKDNAEYINALQNYARLNELIGKYKIAEPLFKTVLEFREKKFGGEHPEVGFVLCSLADLYYFEGRFANAEPMYIRALGILEKEFGTEDKTISDPLNNLGIVYAVQGQYDKSIPLLNRALEIRIKSLGEEHQEVAKSLNNLANFYFDLHNFTEAESRGKKAIEIYEKTLGESHPEYGKALNTIGNIYLEQERFSEAQPYYEKAKKLFEEAFGDEHSDVALATNNLAYLNYKLGKYDEALPLYNNALKSFQKLLGKEHPHVATLIENIGMIYQIRKKYKASEKLFNRALSINLNAIGEHHQDTAETYKHLGFLYEEENNIPEAISYYEKSYAIFETALGKDDPRTIEMSQKLQTLKSS